MCKSYLERAWEVLRGDVRREGRTSSENRNSARAFFPASLRGRPCAVPPFVATNESTSPDAVE